MEKYTQKRRGSFRCLTSYSVVKIPNPHTIPYIFANMFLTHRRPLATRLSIKVLQSSSACFGKEFNSVFPEILSTEC